MIQLNNHYEVSMILNKYTNKSWDKIDKYENKVEKLDWKYVETNQDDDLFVVFKSDIYRLTNGDMVEAFVVLALDEKDYCGFYVSSISYSETVILEEEAKEMDKELEHTSFDMYYVDEDSNEASNHLCIDLNYYSQDIIESNFKEDNGREMTDADWDRYEELYRRIEDGFVKDLEAIGLVNLVSYHDSFGDLCLEFACDLDVKNSEVIADMLKGSVLDSYTERNDCNFLQTYEQDWTDRYSKGEFEEFDDIVSGLTLHIPKGAPLYYMMGGQ